MLLLFHAHTGNLVRIEPAHSKPHNYFVTLLWSITTVTMAI